MYIHIHTHACGMHVIHMCIHISELDTSRLAAMTLTLLSVIEYRQEYTIEREGVSYSL